MKIDFGGQRPIFLQIADNLEEDIARGVIAEESRLLSTTQMAKLYKVNPATANRGVALLVEQGIIYKKRGVGMFVARGAREVIRIKHRQNFYEKYVVALFQEARSIGIDNEELVKMIIEGGKHYG